MDLRTVREAEKEPYSQADPDFFEIVDGLIGQSGTVNYFSYNDSLEGYKGEILKYYSKKDGDFLELSDNRSVRLDRIITILGKPGPSFDKYNHFSNVCFSCFDEGQF